MRTVALRPLTVVSLVLAILSCPAIARAQSVDAYDPGANQVVNTIAVQPDGKTVVGGNFTGLGGVTGTTVRNHIGRLNVDGTVDPTFNPGTNGPVLALAVQPDGKVLAGGNFSSVGGGTGLTSARSRLARFNADGTVDTGFNPGVSGNVWAIAVQQDGKILVGGEFTTLSGTLRNAIGRLSADGSIDAAFNPNVTKTFGNPIVYTLLVQPDGSIVIGGYFNFIGGVTRNFLGRVNTSGAVDSFTPNVNSITGVNALALQVDGKILVGGTFTQLAGTNRANVGRLNADGSLDLAFNPGAETQVLTLGVQTDGKILIGGLFKWLGGGGTAGPLQFVRNYVGRLNPDGLVDQTFNPSANKPVNAVAQQGDGAIVMGGIFDRLNSTPNATTGIVRNFIARITNTTPVTQTLTLTNGGTVETWMRSGGGPEVSRVSFEFSFDGSFYSLLGYGGRVAGGWQLTSVNLPSARRVFLRARGYYDTGQNGSGSIVESILIQGPAATGARTLGDYDADGRADLVVYRPATGTWYTLSSQTGGVTPIAWGLAGDVPVPGDYDGDGATDIAVFRPGSGVWYIQQSTGGVVILQWGLPGDAPVPADYDGDLKTDIAVYRPSSGVWYILQSSTGSPMILAAGAAGDVPVPADYDGDRKADIALYRPSTGEWLIRRSTAPSPIVSTQFGLNGDTPVPGDYDGDAKADIAVYRPTTGTWFMLHSSTNNTSFVSTQFGLVGDIPEPRDYDGDGKTDIAVFRPSESMWYVLQSSGGVTITQFGLLGDIPAPSAVTANAVIKVKPVTPLGSLTPYNDFDGDRKADLTVFRPSNGIWFNLKSGANYTTTSSTQFGLTGDVPVPGDYDGDGKADIAVFRNGTWYILKSSDSTFSAYAWGLTGDIPVPGDYDGDGKTDIAVYRPGSAIWYILRSRDSTLVAYQWGLTGDTPAPGDYDGDRVSDPAVWRPSSGTWYILRSSGNFAASSEIQWGLPDDIAVPGDFDGDGKTDVGVYRPSSGTWYVSQGAIGGTATTLIKQFGLTGDIPVVGDYDGDGKTDIAVFRPSTGTWFLLFSGEGYTSTASYQFGLPGDIPILKRP
jgi:uncharacterized delta-60 repeat protein